MYMFVLYKTSLFVNCIMCMYSGPEAAYYQIINQSKTHIYTGLSNTRFGDVYLFHPCFQSKIVFRTEGLL